jgi:hypothetical protein
MSDQIDETIETEEEDAMKEAADENANYVRKQAEEEFLDNSSDEVITSTSKPERLIATATSNSDDKNKKEAPEMNIQLQH